MNFESISRTIDRALSAAGLGRANVSARFVRDTIDQAMKAGGLGGPGVLPTAERRAPVLPEGLDDEAGVFLERTHTSAHGSRSYRLYVPSGYDGSPRPLLLMLHGCKQDPEDFAAGTRMNELAERHGFLVAYPAQTARANGSNCWNWFDRTQQTREGPEPSLLAGIVDDIGDSHAVDPARVFVAGLSAGAAMALILAAAYPDVFAGVAAHSGLPVGSAHDVPSAFAAMQARRAPGAPRSAAIGVPTIVFHGDADTTVNAMNGAAIISQAVAAFERDSAVLQRSERVEPSVNGRRCTTRRFDDGEGRTLVEEWVVHGGTHSWCGGSPEGSYTDATGPDASAEIVRFFLDRGVGGHAA